MRQQFLNARRYKRAVEQARAGTGAMPPRDLKLEALAGILSGDIRVNVHCYRARDIAAVLTIAREFGFRVGASHHATEAYKIPGLLREAGACAAVWADRGGFNLDALDHVLEEGPLLAQEGGSGGGTVRYGG